jgi:hypothetical protein
MYCLGVFCCFVFSVSYLCRTFTNYLFLSNQEEASRPPANDEERRSGMYVCVKQMLLYVNVKMSAKGKCEQWKASADAGVFSCRRREYVCFLVFFCSVFFSCFNNMTRSQ